MEIQDLLNRRSDLSTFVVHLTKATAQGTASDNLKSILAAGCIEARSAMGWTRGLAASDKDCMKVVCFSETPLEHVYSLFTEIPNRRVQLSGYGLAFTKTAARLRGANPIWYVDMTPGQDAQWQIAAALDVLRDAAKEHAAGFAATPLAKILPFIEQMGTWTATSRKEFWWEREWRHLGSLTFRPAEIALVLCPEGRSRTSTSSATRRSIRLGVSSA